MFAITRLIILHFRTIVLNCYSHIILVSQRYNNIFITFKREHKNTLTTCESRSACKLPCKQTQLSSSSLESLQIVAFQNVTTYAHYQCNYELALLNPCILIWNTWSCSVKNIRKILFFKLSLSELSLPIFNSSFFDLIQNFVKYNCWIIK